MEESIVWVEHVSHRYSIQWAIRDISLNIPGKGIYGLLGSNGAGKSTLMNIICGVIKQTEGDVFIKGVNARKKPVAAKCHIGFLPQKPPLYGDLSVEEYLSHAARIRFVTGKNIRMAVEEVLEKCAISHFRKRVIKNLSGGYQQRVGIAQAIIHKPDLVVLDEPTNGLDPNQILEIRGLIKEIAEERTVVLSTHILSEIEAICDKIIMIEEGKMIFSGSVDDFDNYLTPNTIFLSLLNAPAVSELEQINGVLKVEDLGGKKYRIYFSDAQDVTERILDENHRNGWKLSEIRVEKNSLDSVFAELSKKSK